MMSPVTLAHQGGWDELVVFIVPVFAVLFLLRWAERRSKSVDVAEVDPDEDPGGDGGQEGGELTGEDAEVP